MIDLETVTSGIEEPKVAGTPAEISRARQITDNLADAWANGAAVVDAQVSIWSMKFLRVLVLGALALPLSFCGIALFVYGFVLLDRSADIALSAPGFAPWLSTLVRGGLFFGVPFIGLLIVLFTTVGGLSNEDTKSEDQHA